MSPAPAQPVFRDAAHRRAAMRSLVWRLPLLTLVFGLLGPLIGMALVFAPSFFIQLFVQPAGTLAAIPLIFVFGTPVAYVIGLIPAAFTGFWVTLLATFTASKKQLYAGSAAIGAASTLLCSTAMAMSENAHGSPNSGLILIALIGAASALTCTFIFRWPLGSQAYTPWSFETRSHRRNRLTKARAERLAKAREAR